MDSQEENRTRLKQTFREENGVKHSYTNREIEENLFFIKKKNPVYNLWRYGFKEQLQEITIKMNK